MNPAREEPFWSYEDLALFIGALLPCAAIAYYSVRPFHHLSRGVQTVAGNFVLYLLALGVLYILVARRYDRPLWRSLGFTFQFRGAWICVIAGPPLAIGLAALGALLHAPESTSIQSLITDRTSLVVVVLFAVLIGPIFEELIFRGFLLPLLARSLGPGLGIVLTAVPFGLLHYVTYGWVWQTILVIGIAGVAFGYARVRTGSTVASVMLHMGYNGMLFVGFLLQRWMQ
jgi:membrane protease YdiL (CAAX protease family)